MAKNKLNKVSIVMGSQSDYKTMIFCQNILKKLNIKFETKIISAHRTPKRMYEFAINAEKNGISVIIAGSPTCSSLSSKSWVLAKRKHKKSLVSCSMR